MKIGVIADDFTGASDAASFLVKQGVKTGLFTNIEVQEAANFDAIVIALKSRSVDATKAVEMIEKALSLLKSVGCDRFYFKYCSTFDSTKKGNIGPCLDALMESLNETYTLLCPSLPVNGRTLKQGILYVNNVRLSESSMKNHPLNPMWDSYLPNLMREQSKYPSYCISKQEYQDAHRLAMKINEYKKSSKRFYLIPDYIDDADGKQIMQVFKNLTLLSGGSGLLSHMFKNSTQNIIETQNVNDFNKRSIILCGSCSKATQKQIEQYKKLGKYVYKIDTKRLFSNKLTALQIFEEIDLSKKEILISSCDQNQKVEGDSTCIEQLMGELAKLAIERQIHNIVVAGGETSGAVTLALGFHAFTLGEVIDPGVPALYPLANKQIRLVLKSGNFGSLNFFQKAIGEVNE